MFQNSRELSIKNLENAIAWFTQYPHELGSKRQEMIKSSLVRELKSFGLKTVVQEFDAEIPNVLRNKTKPIEAQQSTRPVSGYNVISSKKGQKNCAIILAGHYDTKYFSEFSFVGANDGGSSTALLLELARILTKHKAIAKSDKSIGNCDINLVFFDGEEATYFNWDGGMERLKKKDNTYGSSFFVEQNYDETNGFKGIVLNHKPVILTVVVDMVGHKKQKLSITKGSDDYYANNFLFQAHQTQQSKNKVSVKKVNLRIEDDHIAFLDKGSPVLHIIDFSNLNEWHTFADTPKIISYEKIKNLGLVILDFISQTQIPSTSSHLENLQVQPF